MFWCDYCKVWMQDNPHAKAVHERGIKHQERVEKSEAYQDAPEIVSSNDACQALLNDMLCWLQSYVTCEERQSVTRKRKSLQFPQ